MSGELQKLILLLKKGEIMDPFSSPPPSGSGSGVSNEVMMDQVKHQLAQAYAEEFFGVGISGTSYPILFPKILFLAVFVHNVLKIFQ